MMVMALFLQPDELTRPQIAQAHGFVPHALENTPSMTENTKPATHKQNLSERPFEKTGVFCQALSKIIAHSATHGGRQD
jgi:hypothetical protein